MIEMTVWAIVDCEKRPSDLDVYDNEEEAVHYADLWNRDEVEGGPWSVVKCKLVEVIDGS